MEFCSVYSEIDCNATYYKVYYSCSFAHEGSVVNGQRPERKRAW